MQARHLDRKRYFEDSAITTARFYLPYIKRFHDITKHSRILEIGCSEGGNLKPFAQMGCQVWGIDMAPTRIKQAEQFFEEEKLEGKFTCTDFLLLPAPNEYDEKFDIIILHDVIEHIPDKYSFLCHLRRFMETSGVLFIAFPAWQMPFGGHQQICRNRIWSKVPFFHLLPAAWYRFILKQLAGEDDGIIKELLYIKQCRCSIERSEKVIKQACLFVQNRQLWLINPHYQQKFGLSPMKLHWVISQLPLIRNFCSTSCFYLLKLP